MYNANTLWEEIRQYLIKETGNDLFEFNEDRERHYPHAYQARWSHDGSVKTFCPPDHRRDDWNKYYRRVVKKMYFNQCGNYGTDTYVMLILDNPEDAPKLFDEDPKVYGQVKNFTIAFAKDRYNNPNVSNSRQRNNLPDIVRYTGRTINDAKYKFEPKHWKTNSANKYAMNRIFKKLDEHREYCLEYREIQERDKKAKEIANNQRTERRANTDALIAYLKGNLGNGAKFKISAFDEHRQVQIALNAEDFENISKFIGQDFEKIKDVYSL